jgi:hypothetical protein
MTEGRDQWLQPLLDQASDNNVAEIMDAEDPLLFYIRLVLLVNQKDGAYHSWIHGVYCLHL